MLLKFLSIILLISTFGCKSNTQVFETKSNNVSTINKAYVFENDSLRITYNFWREKGLMGFEINNKLDVPLYIDWKKSSYIDNSVKLNYWEEGEKTSAVYKSYYYRGNTTGALRATKIKEERLTFIPPKANYPRVQFYIYPRSLSILDKNTPYKEVAMYEGSKQRIKIYEMSFTKEESPIIFRNFLTFSLSEQFTTEFYVDNEFYVSKIMEMDQLYFHNDRKSVTYEDDRNFFIDIRRQTTPHKVIKVDIR